MPRDLVAGHFNYVASYRGNLVERRVRVLKILCVLLVIFLLVEGAWLAKWGWEYYEQEYSFTAKYGLNPDEIYLDGVISVSMARKLEGLLDRAEQPIDTVFVDSPGGTETGAEELVRILTQHPHVSLKLYKGARCFSACVGVFAGVRRLGRAIADDGACFLFHAGRTEVLEEAVPACEVRTPDNTNATDRWAAQISPNLTTFFERCHPNPAHTLRGISIDGKQLGEIANGIYTAKCSDHVISNSCLSVVGSRPQCR